MKILLLCAPALSDSQVRVLGPFLESPSHTLVACLIDNRPAKTALQKLRTNLRKGRGGYVLILAFNRALGSKDPGRQTRAFMEAHDIPVIMGDKPYSNETLAALRKLKPDVLVRLGGFGIVKEPLLNIGRHGVLSYHHGDMRTYRGQPPGFWELYNGEKQMGVTVQRLSAGLDCGVPVVEMTIPIRRADNMTSLRERLFRDSAGMMFAAVERIEDPGFSPPEISSYGHVYTLPNLRQWLLFNLKITVRSIRDRWPGSRTGRTT
jgi:folate-dependent phosphoribosylglycinamide formyltransferase PurN